MTAFTISEAARLSHAYILASPDRAECLNLAGQIAAAAVCRREKDAPCGECRACRKALSGIHPDIRHVGREAGSKGELRSAVTVDQIREVTADAYVLPNEAARKVYILDEADKMNPQAQNALLKTLEEPPEGVIFLLCVENAGQLLPTVRSRCAELSCNAEKSSETEESEKLALAYLRLATADNEAELCRWCLKNERLDRAEAAAFFASAEELLAALLAGRRSEPTIERARLWALHELIARCSLWLQGNVSVRQLFGLLAVDSIAGGGNRGKTSA